MEERIESGKKKMKKEILKANLKWKSQNLDTTCIPKRSECFCFECLTCREERLRNECYQKDRPQKDVLPMKPESHPPCL